MLLAKGKEGWKDEFSLGLVRCLDCASDNVCTEDEKEVKDEDGVWRGGCERTVACHDCSVVWRESWTSAGECTRVEKEIKSPEPKKKKGKRSEK